MKISLMYNYNMDNPTLYRTNKNLYIKWKNKRYILMKINSSDELYEIIEILKNKNISNDYYEIEKTMNNSPIFLHDGIAYALIKIKNVDDTIEEKLKTTILLHDSKYMLDRSNWFFLWCKKNDYIEYKNEHINEKIKEIDESIDYYIGMAETAISYLNNVKIKNKELTVAHRRINESEINNPLNIVVDVKERDLSEYLKYIYITKKYDTYKIMQVIQKIYSENLSVERIYARILYPNYYFDLLDKQEKNIETKKEIEEIIKRIDEYENFLKYIYNIITKKNNIKKIDWL